MAQFRTIIDTGDRLRPGDHIQNPEGKWMSIADITYATNDGISGALAVLLVDPNTAGTHGARLMVIGSGYTLNIRRGPGYSPRPYPATERTKIRRTGLGYEVWDTRCLEWVYILPGDWKDPFGAYEADERTLSRWCRETAMADPEVARIVTALRSSAYLRTAEHVLNTSPAVVDRAVGAGLILVDRVQSTTYNRRGERMLAAAA